MHRLHFESGRVTLTLAFAEVLTALRQFRCAVDAFYLDGFAPGRNPAMWTQEVFKRCAALARPDATLATYTAAASVREGLEAAGFSVARARGLGRKRHMLVASPRRTLQQARAETSARARGERRAIVIGAGLAGAAACERLAARGWEVVLVERLGTAAGATSGMHAGVVHPHVSLDDSVLSRLSRSGFLYGIAAWRALEGAGHRLSWNLCGVAHPARHAPEENRMARIMRSHGYPASYATFLDRGALSEACGVAVAHGGCWYPQGGWIQPAALVRAQLAHADVKALYRREVHTLAHFEGGWRALAADGSIIAQAPVAVLANSIDATRLAPAAHALKRMRGQLSYLPAHALPALRSVIVGRGCALPPVGGITVVGGGYDADDGTEEPTEAGHRRNLAALAQVLCARMPALTAATLAGAVGFRAIAGDRLPFIGAMPDLAAIGAGLQRRHGVRLSHLPRLPGLYGAFGYGSRGLTWAALGGELLASLIEGEPCPVEGSLADAIDPARMALRRIARGLPVQG
jgi:tRNA 5-methylaminomethyl-2-thiouridine biosynthesis bifunctional protein